MSTSQKDASRLLMLSPIDAWFFRDGRPYNAKESNQTDVMSLFPPPATTLVGAIRAGLARSTKEWDGTSNWATNPKLANVLGKDFNDLGQLSFGGPYLLQERDGRSDLLFPMPMHVLGKLMMTEGSDEPAWEAQCLLTPDSAKTCCDLGDDVRLPVTSAERATPFEKEGLKEPSSQWVTPHGLQRILCGQLPQPAEVVEVRDLWKHEVRIGLERDAASRTTKEGALYSPRFVRLKPGVSLVMSITGLPSGWEIPTLLPLGGENRLADCRGCDVLSLPDFVRGSADTLVSNATARKEVAVTLLSPLLPEDADGREPGQVETPRPGQPFFGCEGTTVISGCVGKPQTLGGWNSLERRPLDLRPVLPAGSVWFVEVEDDEVAAFTKRCQSGFGLKTNYGFGQVALGVWPASG